MEDEEKEARDLVEKVSAGCGPSPDREIIEEKQVMSSSKVSTGCGTSPDREIEEIFANEHVNDSMKSFAPLRETASRSSKVSIGTSPPPQSTSTQVTYWNRRLMKVKINFLSSQTYDATSFDAELEPEPFQYPSEGRFAGRGLRRSHSFAATNSRFSDSQTLQRSISRQSFSSEIQVINKSWFSI